MRMSARSLILVTLASFCAALGALALTTAPALAAAPGVEGEAASSVTATGATLEAQVNPNNQSTTYDFEYSTSATGETLNTPVTTLAGAGPLTGSGNQTASVKTGAVLAPGTTYFYRVIAKNASSEETKGKVKHFTTVLPPEVPGPVTVQSPVGARRVTVHGILNPDNASELGTYEFLYKASATKACAGGAHAPSAGLALGFEREEVTEGLTGLTPNTEYAVCLLARNGAGEEAVGPAVMFTTVAALETPETKPANPIAANTATLNGVLNPKGKRESEPGDYEFRYRQSATECQGENEKATPTATPLGHEAEAVKAPVTELLPHTRYTFCLLATNDAGEEALGPAVTFTTLEAAPVVSEESVLEDSATSATFQAKINPQNLDTKYRFEYDTREYVGNEAHGERIPSPEGELSAGLQGVAVEANPQDLKAGTVYHFRVVAESSGGTSYGADETFTTQSPPQKAVLPDGRQWELVSPADKHGTKFGSVGGDGDTQASVEGDAITYGANAPIGTNPPSSALNSTQIFSRRGPSGWYSQDISTPTEEALETPSKLAQYSLFSSDLSLGVLEPISETPLTPGASGLTVYLREDTTGNLVAIGKRTGGLISTTYSTSTPDFSHIIFDTEEGFVEWSAGQKQPISCAGQIGDGQGSEGLTPTPLHAISSDGSRFVCHEGNPQTESEQLYLRTVSGEEVQLNVPEPGCGSCASSRPSFQAASSDDSKIFFTDEGGLKAGSGRGSGSRDLYEFTVTSGSGEKIAGELTDLTPVHNGEEARVEGQVLGVSEDGSYVYFVARGELAPGATPGELNVYVNHDGTTTFIATVSSDDDILAGDYFGGYAKTVPLVSHNGRYLTFMSERELTGYDNVDIAPEAGGAHDEEVFLYDAQTGRLACVSCDPTGARPLGLHDEPNLEAGYDTPLVDGNFTWTGRWLAGSIPGYSGLTGSDAIYQQHYLTDEGRLFFDSSDGLVPQHTSGKMAVYEYEPEGVGSCERASATFSESTGGCVGLISPGTSGEEAAFLDASENGDDVFFLAAGKLTSASVEGINVYDAHVCSEAVPCAAEVVSPPACVTADSCRAAPSPQPTVFGASGSATFSGAGNITPGTSPATGPGVAKPLTRALKPAKALKACHKKRGRKRTLCERQAKRQYGAKPKASRKGGK
jgi:hypothetical protein